jgi:hypothetical protein
VATENTQVDLIRSHHHGEWQDPALSRRSCMATGMGKFARGRVKTRLPPSIAQFLSVRGLEQDKQVKDAANEVI